MKTSMIFSSGSSMMAVDKEFTAIVHAWEFRLGVLNQMVGSVEPRPIVWENIKAAIGQASAPQEPLVLPEAPPPPPPVEQIMLPVPNNLVLGRFVPKGRSQERDRT